MQNSSSVSASVKGNRLVVVVEVPRQLASGPSHAEVLMQQSLTALPEVLSEAMDGYRDTVKVVRKSSIGINDVGSLKISAGERTQSNKDNVVFYIPAPKSLGRCGCHGTAVQEHLTEQLATLLRRITVVIEEYWKKHISSRTKAPKKAEVAMA